MAPGARKICLGSNVFQVPIQNITSGDTKVGEPSPPWLIKIVMACLRTILTDKSLTVGNSPLRCSNSTLNPIYQPTYPKVDKRQGLHF